MAELLLKEPLFLGNSEIDQLEKIFKVLGNPKEASWPGWESLKFGQHVKNSLKKKNNKNRLREKFPIIPMTPDDFMYLSAQGLDLMQGLLTYDPK